MCGGFDVDGGVLVIVEEVPEYDSGGRRGPHATHPELPDLRKRSKSVGGVRLPNTLDFKIQQATTALTKKIKDYDMQVGRCGCLSRAHVSLPEFRGSNIPSWPRHLHHKVARVLEIMQHEF